jgi:hypothetical protein
MFGITFGISNNKAVLPELSVYIFGLDFEHAHESSYSLDYVLDLQLPLDVPSR